MILRPFQADMVAETRTALRTHRSVLMQLPTGGGKTVIASFMLKSALEKGLIAWFVCHRDFLVHQTSRTLRQVGVPHGFVASGLPMSPHALTQICSIDTLKNRLDRVPEPNLIIWDEAHHLGAAGWAKVMAWAARSKHVGLSATPARLDGKGLDKAFDAMVRGPSVSWLIENGYLSTYRAFAPNEVDLSGLRKTAGDFNAADLEKIMSTKAIIGDMVHHYRQHADGTRAIYFCATIMHSQTVAAAFNQAGIRALHIDAKSNPIERKHAAILFARGDVKVLVNVGLFGEGYDLAAQAGSDVTVETVGLARPTASLALHLQQIGRALRPKDHPAIILDHAGNLVKHGLPDDEREWSLHGITKKKGDDDEAGGKRCPSCFGVHRPLARCCPYCGFEYTRGDGGGSKGIENVDGELEEIDVAAIRRGRVNEEHACTSAADLAALGRRRGYAHPERWAARIWSLRDRKAQIKAEAQAAQYQMI